MARNRYAGTCYCCKQFVPVGYGHFERFQGGWRIKCVKCVSGRTVKDTDKEVIKARFQAVETALQDKNVNKVVFDTFNSLQNKE